MIERNELRHCSDAQTQAQGNDRFPFKSHNPFESTGLTSVILTRPRCVFLSFSTSILTLTLSNTEIATGAAFSAALADGGTVTV